MDGHELVGFAASTLTTVAFVPQVLKTVRTRHTADMSSQWVVMFGCGIALWVVYGLWLESMPIIAGNLITLALLGVIAWCKFVLPDLPLTEALPGPFKESA